ncbi:MAG: hypothetical protein QOH36_1377 [Actinomycetota bacterium]|nr:hypothetical protein [Actinomycetota bacterium]
MSRTRSRVVAVGALVAVTLLLVTPAATADSVSDEARVLSLLNQTRAAVGAPALGLNTTLSSVARTWAAAMATAGRISHNPSLSTQVVGWSRLGENVGVGPSVDAVHEALRNSPGHYANMVDSAFNAVGIGVAYAGGSVYVVQDFATLAVPAPRPPALPTEVTPAGGTLRTSPTQASARYSDPDGTSGYVYFVLVDAAGVAVRQGWSTPACSGCVATFAFAAVPDGLYALYAAANDGVLASGWSGPQVFWVDRTAPAAPTAVTATRTQASARYTDPDGAVGYVYFWVVGPGGAVVREGWSGATCNGCTATFVVPMLGPGVHVVYAVAYDGLASPITGPVSITL